MKYYLFVLLFTIITIINGCAASNFNKNQIYKSKQKYKCDIIIDNLYTKDNLSFSTFADSSYYFMLSLLKLLENDIQLEFSNINIVFLPVKDNITGMACFETNSSKVYADIINGVIHGNIVENNKTNGRLTSTCEVNNGKVDTYTYYAGNSEYSINYEFNTISFYHKNHMVLYTDLEENTAEYYYDNGNISKEVKFKNGVLDGIARYYFKSGALQEERHYKNGLRNGNTERYSEKGALWATITYKDDKPVSGICGNGRKWTKAELINWENGVAVTCEYY